MSERRFDFLNKRKPAEPADTSPAQAEILPDESPLSHEEVPSPAQVEDSAPAAPTRRQRPRTQPPEAPKRRGRPSGKRSDGDHVQVTAYIRKKTQRSVKIALVKDEHGPDFSELVEELLDKWLKSRS